MKNIKMIMLILGIVLIVSLVGCVPPEQQTDTVQQNDNVVVSTDQQAPVSEPLTTVSQEDLDQLKEDLEKMEFEDLGGLS